MSYYEVWLSDGGKSADWCRPMLPSITQVDPRCRSLWLATLLTVAAWTATGSATQLEWSVRTWQIPDGSTNTVTGVAQSPDGYLWVATLAGLNQFDGVRFESHAFGRPFGLADSRVRMLLACRGGLWAAFDGSVVYLKSGAPPRVIRENIPSTRAESMVEDDQGALWIGYRSGTICRIADGRVTVLKGDAGVPMLSGEQPSLAIDNTGQLWVATGTRIGVIRNGRFTEMVQAPSTSFLARARGGGLWICSGFTLYQVHATGRAQGVSRPADSSTRHRANEAVRKTTAVHSGSAQRPVDCFASTVRASRPFRRRKRESLASEKTGRGISGRDRTPVWIAFRRGQSRWRGPRRDCRSAQSARSARRRTDGSGR